MLFDFTMLPNNVYLCDMNNVVVIGIADNQQHIVCEDQNKRFTAIHIDSLSDFDREILWRQQVINACRL